MNFARTYEKFMVNEYTNQSLLIVIPGRIINFRSNLLKPEK